MLFATDITVTRGSRCLLDSVSLAVHTGSRIGVTGPNGVGKTTLLRVLAGELAADSGRIERRPANLRVAMFPQESDARRGETLLEYLSRRSGMKEAEESLDAETERLGTDPSALDDYSDALERFLALGGDDFAARAGTVAASVGLAPGCLGEAVESMSGGQSARARLVSVMLSRADVLLLDEPTNDLDFSGLSFLEATLAAFPGAVVMVSHDRAFLDLAATAIFDLDGHSHKASLYAGAWSEFVERRALAQSHASVAYQSWKAERDRLKARVRAQRAWSEEGVRRARTKPADNDKIRRSTTRERTEKQASKVRISEKALARLGEVDKPWEGWKLHLDLAHTGRSGDVVVRLSGAAVAANGPWRLGPADLEVNWADRVVITGPNGGGKSTLLRALTGDQALDEGRRWVGPSVRFGQLDQARAGFASDQSLVDSLVGAGGATLEEVRSTLAKFDLGAGHVNRPYGRLSPGERTRAALARLSLSRTNCLVLDEPTNHLDLPAIEQLEEALESFEGTLLVVTHDRWMLQALRFDRHLEVEGGTVTEIPAEDLRVGPVGIEPTTEGL
ncbi:MAG: ABC-F family ATP-binding cassette domain-containing protein [Acidimicrobiales bacterium]